MVRIPGLFGGGEMKVIKILLAVIIIACASMCDEHITFDQPMVKYHHVKKTNEYMNFEYIKFVEDSINGSNQAGRVYEKMEHVLLSSN